VIVQSHPSGADAWLVVAGPTSVLALPQAESSRLPDLAARLGGADGFRAALESLVGDGIAGSPSFALLEGDSVVLRVVLRGEAAVTASMAGAEVAFSGAGVATWTERVLEGAGSVQLSVPGSRWTVQFDEAARPAVAESAVAAPAENTLVPSTDSEPPAAAPPAAAPVPPKPMVEEPMADPDSEAYDFLFGDTIYRTRAGASIRIPNPDPERPGDHDGQTLLAEDLGLAGRSEAPEAPEGDASAASEATVLAPIPPHANAAPPEPAPSLPLAVALQLERADGSRESLSRPVLIGRSPAASSDGSDVRLITIADDPDISRTHLRVAVEGDVVVVTDLGSKNGSIVTLPGSPPRKLRVSEPTVVLPDTLIDLGGGTTFTVRED
jgi:hypothetical protein